MNIRHLLSNTIPLLTLMLVLFTFYKKVAVKTLLLSIVFTGVLVWLFARGQTIHIGASGVIYALAAFLIAYGVFKKKLKSIVISLAIILMYGGLVFGLLPMQPYISWEGHLFGALSGVFIAYQFRNANIEA